MVANIGFLRQIQGRSSFSMSRLPTRTTERPWVINGTILRTTDGGSSWVPQTSGTTKTLYGVSFTDENNGTVVGFEFGGTVSS